MVVEIAGRTPFTEEFLASLVALPEGERIRSCLQCGTCSGICPHGFAMEYPPGAMIGLLRGGHFDNVLGSDSAWLCISCYACTYGCPAKIPLTAGLMTRTKEELIMAGKVPTELQEALQNTQRQGNVFGESPRKRAEWTRGAETPVPILGEIRRPVDTLWFVGDYGSYHPRVTKASRALATVLARLGCDFAILGPEEQADGDSQRLAGERGLFEMLAEKNGRVFRRYQFDRIMTADPHAFNALANEYPRLGIEYPVQHHTQYLAERLEALAPLLSHPVPARVTYHDPCYLGRANGIFDPPRQLLGAIPGVELVEMEHHRNTSLCCGGGGGGMWLDGFHWERLRARVSEWRVREALAVGAEILAVACPYELPRFEDATKTVPGASALKVREVSELLAEALGATLA